MIKNSVREKRVGISARLSACLAFLVLLVCFAAGCDIIEGFLNNEVPDEENIPAEINLDRASNDSWFEWDGNAISGLTDAGKTQVNIVIPQRAASIKDGAFARNGNIKSIGFQNQNIALGKGLFLDCSALEKVQLPANIRAIPASLFKGCRSLKEITIPDQVTVIEEMAFYQCVSLERAEHGDRLEQIGRHAFHTCDRLAKFDFSASLTTIGEGAFAWCYSLERVILTGSGLEILEARAFSDCSILTTVVIPEGIKVIDKGVFSECPMLGDVTLPASVVEIDPTAFKSTGASKAVQKVFKIRKDSYADLHFGFYAQQTDTLVYY